MTTDARPLLLDVGAAFAPDASETDRAVTRALAAHPAVALLIRHRGGRLEAVARSDVAATAPLDASDGDRVFAGVRGWLLGGERPASLPPANRAMTRPTLRAALRPRRPASDPPPGALVLKPGIDGWADAGWRALLQRRPDLRSVAIVAEVNGLDWPEYEPADRVAGLHRNLAALGTDARMAVVPDEATRRRLAAALASPERAAMRIHRVPCPSPLAETKGERSDAALAAVSFMVAPGVIEARSNTLLLLHLWRDGLRDGIDVPKLILAGRRGAQIEEIRPLLDWNEALRAAVLEAPALSPQNLRRLMVDARAVLAPAFVDPVPALLRDAAALGARVIAAYGAGLPDSPDALDPLDGPGWRHAILQAAGQRVEILSISHPLPDWTSYADRIVRLAGTV